MIKIHREFSRKRDDLFRKTEGYLTNGDKFKTNENGISNRCIIGNW